MPLTVRKKNEFIRNNTKVSKVTYIVVNRALQLKWDYVGHIVLVKDNRWNEISISWRPWAGRRSRRRPVTRWYEDLKK